MTNTWRRFTSTVAALAGVALIVGLALSYGSAYAAAYDAGFDTIWIQGGDWQLRPAHLFPFTLDVPVLVGYAGTIALAGRRSVTWARLVLVVCSAATIALQVLDGADLIKDNATITALVHGWPPALGILTAHLLVKILQALGFLVPPVAEAERPSWVARTWAWAAQVLADMRTTRQALARGDMDRVIEADTRTAIAPPTQTDTWQDNTADMRADINGPEAAPQEDTAPDISRDIAADKPQVTHEVIPFTGQRGRLVSAVLAGTMTQAEAARRGKVTPKTIGRWVKAAREAQDTQTAVNG
jgi:hypothetical protein